MRDNVIWVDFSSKRKTKGRLKRFFSSIISPFINFFCNTSDDNSSNKNSADKNSTYKNISKKNTSKAHKSIL